MADIKGLMIREETPEDYKNTEGLVREAFFNRYAPGCNEHFIVNQVRQAQGFAPWHSLVAEYEGNLIGQCLLVPSLVKTEGREVAVFTLGPVCVLPACYHRGIGSALMQAMIKTAREQGVLALFLIGDPRYYRRFGFAPASSFGIHLPGLSMEEEAGFFMALPLQAGALEGVNGLFVESKLYEVDKAAFEAYDKGFPERKKMRLPGQLG